MKKSVYISILGILISGFFGVSQVNAENVIVEQLNKDTVEAIPSIGLFGSQTLGTGLTGEISEIIMWGKTGGGNVDAEIFLHECLIGYSNCLVKRNSFTDYGTYITVTDTGNSLNYILDVPFTLDATKYYRIFAQPKISTAKCGGGSWTCYAYGSNSNTYANGESEWTTNILDVYFRILAVDTTQYQNSISITYPISTTTPLTNVDLYVNYFNDGTFDTLNWEGLYESNNFNTAFSTTTEANTGLVVGDTINLDLETGSAVLWRAFLTSTATTTSPLYSDFENFSVVSNPYPNLIGVDSWDQSFNLATSTCSITNISGCFQNSFIFLFKPSQNSFQSYIDLKEEIQYKPPFGYFFAVKNAFDDFNATTTPAYTWEIPSILSDMFAPIKTGFSWLLWILFGFWVFRTLSKLQT